MDLKKRIGVKCTVWSVALYGAETRTMTKADRERLEVFEMWVWQRMEKISWVDKVRNVEVFQKVKENRNSLNTVQQQKLIWTGHTLRHELILCDITEGRMLDQTTRGQKRLQNAKRRHEQELRKHEEAGDRNRW